MDRFEVSSDLASSTASSIDRPQDLEVIEANEISSNLVPAKAYFVSSTAANISWPAISLPPPVFAVPNSFGQLAHKLSISSLQKKRKEITADNDDLLSLSGVDISHYLAPSSIDLPPPILHLEEPNSSFFQG